MEGKGGEERRDLVFAFIFQFRRPVELFSGRRHERVRLRPPTSLWSLPGGCGASQASTFLILEVNELPLLSIFAVAKQEIAAVYDLGH